ncbi:MAG: right-handed parallel beta-helix repeat-containing protein [Ignavibacteria bacterium]|nr:right-handed parallel beta-helix repeat-containing protein [Ignavibacteria bacterium]
MREYTKSFTIKSMIAVIAIILFSFVEAMSATFYISNNGNDKNNGLSPLYPWRTVTKLNSMMREFSPGDMIFFERGSYFVGQINIGCSGNDNEPVTFGAYGAGIEPVISGSLPLRNWTLDKNGIYRAQSDSTIRNLFINGKQLILARYPNSGYLQVKERLSNPKSGFRDKALSQPKGYWNGANVRIRTINWAYEHSSVKNFQSGTVTLSNPTSFPIEKDWGYHFDNKLSELDTQNEWFYQEEKNGKGTVYLKPPTGVDPNKAFIEGSFIGLGFFSNINLINVIIRDLSFVNQTDIAIYFNGKNRRVSIENCSFTGQRLHAVYFPSTNTNAVISNCRFSGINGEALYLNTSRSAVISINLFANIGMIPGYGTTGTAFGMSAIVVLSSDSNHITGNYINGVGHDGINCIGKANLIEKNVLKNVLLYLNDGGAIKSYGVNSNGSVWRNNFVSDVLGNIAGAPLNNRLMAYGLYADAGNSNMRIENNTVVDCSGSGIFLYEGCNNNVISNNVCMNNPIGIKFRVDVQNTTGNQIMNNEFVGIQENQFAVRFISRSGSFLPGNFDKNTYVFPRNDAAFQYERLGKLDEYDIDGWKNVQSGKEKDPVFLNDNQFLFPEIFRNMTSDSMRYLLDASVEYVDKDKKKIFGAVSVNPWTSKILYANSDRSKSSHLEIISDEMDFGKSSAGSQSEAKWFVISVMNFNSPITVKAPDGFLLSREADRNFSSSLSISPSLKEQDMIIFIRFAPNAEKGYFGYAEVSALGKQRLIRLSGTSR